MDLSAFEVVVAAVVKAQRPERMSIATRIFVVVKVGDLMLQSLRDNGKVVFRRWEMADAREDL